MFMITWLDNLGACLISASTLPHTQSHWSMETYKGSPYTTKNTEWYIMSLSCLAYHHTRTSSFDFLSQHCCSAQVFDATSHNPECRHVGMDGLCPHWIAGRRLFVHSLGSKYRFGIIRRAFRPPFVCVLSVCVCVCGSKYCVCVDQNNTNNNCC